MRTLIKLKYFRVGANELAREMLTSNQIFDESCLEIIFQVFFFLEPCVPRPSQTESYPSKIVQLLHNEDTCRMVIVGSL